MEKLQDFSADDRTSDGLDPTLKSAQEDVFDPSNNEEQDQDGGHTAASSEVQDRANKAQQIFEDHWGEALGF